MRIFGFEITKVSKIDNAKVATFEEVVYKLQENCKEYINFLKDLPIHIAVMFDPDSADANTERYELISTTNDIISTRTIQLVNLIRMYTSHPLGDMLTGVIYTTSISKLNAYSAKLQALLKTHIDMEKRMNEMSLKYGDEYEACNDPRYNMMVNKYNEFLRQENQLIDETIQLLSSEINRLRAQGKYDVFEIQFGVDLIKTRLKRKKIKEPDMNPKYIVKIFDNSLGVD